MKQLLFCYKEDRKLRVRYTIVTDVFVSVEDVVSPQKTTLKVLKTDKIKLSDIIIIRDNNSGKIEYIGYIDTITTKTTTEISCYPLINVFDNDFVLDQMFEETTNSDGIKVDSAVDVIQWLQTQIARAFLSTTDDLQALPLFIRNKTKSPVFYKGIIDTANLLEVYTDLFINTGVFVKFSDIEYEGVYIKYIYCDIYCNTDEESFHLRYDNPSIQSVDIVDNTFTNYNKIIATQELEEGSTAMPQRYYFYLLDNNDVTTNENDSRRIKQVRSKAITFKLEDTQQATAEALLLSVYNELQSSEYNLQIDIVMFANDNIKLHKIVDFVAESGIIYTSRITKIEKLNDKQISITLGALRNSLTDFKKKVEAI